MTLLREARSLIALVLTVSGAAAAQTTDMQPQPPVVGRWNITVSTARGMYPAWLELQKDSR